MAAKVSPRVQHLVEEAAELKPSDLNALLEALRDLPPLRRRVTHERHAVIAERVARVHAGNVETESLPPDWNDYLRYRFEQGRAAIARGDYSATSPAKLMARVRARVEKNK